MFNKPSCTVANDIEKRSRNSNNYFLRLVSSEGERVSQLRAQEIQLTAEDPRVRAQDEATDICSELREYKKRQLLEEKRRQQIRANSCELRQLEAHLRAASVSKQLDEQRIALQKRGEEELRAKREENARYEAEYARLKEMSREEEEKERLKKRSVRGVLQAQMAEIQKRRMEEYEEVLVDREERQKLQQRLLAEDISEREEKERRRMMCRHEMEESLRNKLLRKEEEREQSVDESERDTAYLRERDELRERLESEKRRLRLEKQALSERIGQQLEILENEKRQREDLLLGLLVEERKAKEDLRFKRNLEKQVQERAELRTQFERQRQDMLDSKLNRQNEEDKQFREEQLRIMAERDKLEQLSNERRRKKELEHGRAVQRMIEEKRRQRAAVVAEGIREYEILSRMERDNQQRVEEERCRMLRAQPDDLLSYLPPGVLRTTDREFLKVPGQEV